MHNIHAFNPSGTVTIRLGKRVLGYFVLNLIDSSGVHGVGREVGEAWVAVGHGSCSLPFPLHPTPITEQACSMLTMPLLMHMQFVNAG